MRSLLLLLGLPNMPAPELAVLIGLVAVGALLLGWIADIILHEAGFGVILNGVIIIVGALIGVMLWQRLGLLVGSNQHLTAAIIAATSGIVLLISCGVGKRLVA